MIRYFLEGLKRSVRAQIDVQSWDLNSWEEAIEKAVNVKAKTILQSSFSTRDMDSRYPRGNRPAKKEEKDSSGKNKSTNSPSANTSSGRQSSSTQQTSSANPKKDQDHQQGPWRRGRWRDKVVTPTPLSRVSILFPRRKGRTETCPKSNAITVIGKDITSTSVLKIQRKSQKINDGLDDLHAGDCS